MENKFNNQGKCNNSQVGTLSLSGNPTELRIIKSGPQKRKIKEAKYNQEERDNQLVFGPDGDAIQIWIVFLRRKSQRGGGPIWFFIPIDWHSNAVVIVVVIVKRWRHKRRYGPLHPPHHHQQISYLFIPIFFFFFGSNQIFGVVVAVVFFSTHAQEVAVVVDRKSMMGAVVQGFLSLSLVFFIFFTQLLFFFCVSAWTRVSRQVVVSPLGKNRAVENKKERGGQI